MHFVQFANVIGCNNMLMLKYCKSLQRIANFCKFLGHLFYFILFYMCEMHKFLASVFRMEHLTPRGKGHI